MATLYTHKAENIRRTWMLFGVFGLLIGVVGFFFAQYFGDSLFFILSLAFAFMGSFFSYWFSDSMILALTRAKPVEKRDDPELYRLVENLSITAGLTTPKIYMINDPSPNAFATGRNPKKAVIAITTGLRERLDKQELEGVIAHELSHVGNNDIKVATIAAILAGVIITVVQVAVRVSFFGGGDRKNKGPLIIIGVLASFILAPIAATMLRLAISRSREFLADSTGALLTRYPEGLARALEKIKETAMPLRFSPEMANHLWVSEPKRTKTQNKTGFVSKLFLTHPPIDERIKQLREMSV